jgi:hypothetical protein
VEYPQFIVCDSTNYFAPIIYTLNNVNMTEARDGFTHRGIKYPGVVDIIDDLKWAIENNVWNMSRKNYLSGGVVNVAE